MAESDDAWGSVGQGAHHCCMLCARASRALGRRMSPHPSSAACLLRAPFTKGSFEELYDVVYWIRQVLAVVIGIAWGIIPLTGMSAMAG